ncbi:alkaline phosphatase family protein [Cutibacterium sp. WCA-380-WT-3A]|uniref:Alkaline phosphatase family protein n=1 Tax=Cutibacterium porci TaxID=2605781 RepID=A0A7K0J6K8_9ACTN|nr:nucleotide pyrophosphatase/phosphodiesterase family protein [Cutibacterium porci]MSS45605.1 alkaline phosphatase family protein [Cutibacterium porci]
MSFALASDLTSPGPKTLSHLVPAMGRALLGEGPAGLGLPDATRYVLLLVDGMGRDNLEQFYHLAPILSDMQKCHDLTCQVPSTTATSLSCIGTGTVPGRHGVAGYTFRAPSGRAMNALSWANGDDPEIIQPHPTAFEALVAAGVTVSSVGPARFQRSGLTRASLRGPQFIPIHDEDDVDERVDKTVRASRSGDVSLTYVYERSLDHVGHGEGWQSSAWRSRLMWVDNLVGALLDELDPGTVLVVTADHGMIDVPGDHRVMVEDEGGLLADVDLLAGEPRFRHIYTRHPDDVAQRWQRVLGDRAQIVIGDHAVAAGLFGRVDASTRSRFGDVLAITRSDWAIMSRATPKELTLVGMHGSLTRCEMRVPLLAQICEG